MTAFMASSFLLLGLLAALMGLWMFWTSRSSFFENREKSSAFECGFDPKDKSRVPFSLRFFLMVMLFMVFDVELSLLLKVPFQMELELFKKRMMLSMFLGILILGTLEEWRRGILSWKL